jgi:hypothetical protein
MGRRFFSAANEARKWTRIQPGLATSDALGDVASVRDCCGAGRLASGQRVVRVKQKPDARLTGGFGKKRGPCKSDRRKFRRDDGI